MLQAVTGLTGLSGANHSPVFRSRDPVLTNHRPGIPSAGPSSDQLETWATGGCWRFPREALPSPAWLHPPVRALAARKERRDGMSSSPTLGSSRLFSRDQRLSSASAVTDIAQVVTNIIVKHFVFKFQNTVKHYFDGQYWFRQPVFFFSIFEWDVFQTFISCIIECILTWSRAWPDFYKTIQFFINALNCFLKKFCLELVSPPSVK